MLSHIFLRDFAIIETLDLELEPGMTALTGETGAGKSILIDAIGLVLGDRADSGVVRHGAEKTEITLSIDLPIRLQHSSGFRLRIWIRMISAFYDASSPARASLAHG